MEKNYQILEDGSIVLSVLGASAELNQIESMSGVKKNQECPLLISEIQFKGFGIGYANQFPVWVPNALPGEYGIVRILKVNRLHAYGKWISRSLSSENRIESGCEIFGKCGGCQIRHLNETATQQYRKSQIEMAFSEFGLSVPQVNVFEARNTDAFRNQGRFSVQSNRNGSLDIGLFGLGNQRIVDVGSRCAIQHPLTNQIVSLLRSIDRITPIAKDVRSFVSRVSFEFNNVVLGLSGPGLTSAVRNALIKELGKYREIRGVVYWKTDLAWSNDEGQLELLWGDRVIEEKIGRILYKYDVGSFFQSNTMMGKTLLDRVQCHVGVNAKRVLDLYCGVGFFSIALAAQGHSVMGIEFDSNAIAFAKENRILNDIKNCEFVAQNADNFSALAGGQFDTVIVDPPRTGLSQSVREQLKFMRPRQIVYVSCNPLTLARDLADLSGSIFEISEMEVVEMFPGSYHCEVVTILISRE